jgi:hypothetical protein
VFVTASPFSSCPVDPGPGTLFTSDYYFESILEKRRSGDNRTGGEQVSGSVPDGVEQEARALGDPTRHRIFRYIARPNDRWVSPS